MVTSMLKTHPEFLAEFGEFTILFSHTEHNIKEFIGILLDEQDEQVGEIMTAGSSFKTIWHNLMSLYRHKIRDEVKISSLKKILEDIDDINEIRNDHIHGIWYFSTEVIVRRNPKANFRKGLHDILIDYDIDKLRKLSQQLFDANKELLKIDDEIRSQVRTFYEPPQP